VWVLSADGSGEPVLFAGSRYDELAPQISMDGRWASYISAESGLLEVYVQAFPTPGPRYVISDGGGSNATWGSDGRILYFSRDNQPVVTYLQFDERVRVVRREMLFKAAPTDDVRNAVTGTISRDFDRLYVSIDARNSGEQFPFTIVQNWRSALEPQ
jgi:Tol biopolymer transport system component